MPWTLDLQGLFTVLVVAFVAGFGWAAGVWLWGRITSFTNRPPKG